MGRRHKSHHSHHHHHGRGHSHGSHDSDSDGGRDSDSGGSGGGSSGPGSSGGGSPGSSGGGYDDNNSSSGRGSNGAGGGGGGGAKQGNSSGGGSAGSGSSSGSGGSGGGGGGGGSSSSGSHGGSSGGGSSSHGGTDSYKDSDGDDKRGGRGASGPGRRDDGSEYSYTVSSGDGGRARGGRDGGSDNGFEVDISSETEVPADDDLSWCSCFAYLRGKEPNEWNHPHSRLRRYWNFIMFLGIMYNAVFMPLRSVFETDIFVWYFVDYGFDFIFIIDIIWHLNILGYVHRGSLVLDPLLIRHNYIHTEMVFDVLGTAPFDLVLVATGQSRTLVAMVRLLRLIRLKRVPEYAIWWEYYAPFPFVTRIFKLVIYLGLLSHWVGCLFFFIVQYQRDDPTYSDENDWAQGIGLETVEISTATVYSKTLFWAITLLTGMGPDQNSPNNALELMFDFFAVITGVLVFAAIIGQVGSLIANADLQALNFRNRIDAVKVWLTSRNLDPAIAHEVLEYYEYQFSKEQGLSNEEIMSDFPAGLHRNVSLALHRQLFEQVSFLKDAPVDLLAELAQKLQLEVFVPGEIIMRAGEVGHEMYFISSGVVRVESKNGKWLVDLVEGMFFGEIALLSNNLRTASCIAKHYVDCYRLTKATLQETVKGYPEFAARLRQVAQRRLGHDTQHDGFLHDRFLNDSGSSHSVEISDRGKQRLLQDQRISEARRRGLRKQFYEAEVARLRVFVNTLFDITTRPQLRRQYQRAVFHEYDHDLSGSIDSSEFVSCFSAMMLDAGLPALIPPPEIVQAMFHDNDIDHSGSLDKREFVSMVDQFMLFEAFGMIIDLVHAHLQLLVLDVDLTARLTEFILDISARPTLFDRTTFRAFCVLVRDELVRPPFPLLIKGMEEMVFGKIFGHAMSKSRSRSRSGSVDNLSSDAALNVWDSIPDLPLMLRSLIMATFDDSLFDEWFDVLDKDSSGHISSDEFDEVILVIARRVANFVGPHSLFSNFNAALELARSNSGDSSTHH